MHRDVKEMLIGLAGITLFGAAIIASPPFARFVDQYLFSYVNMIWDLPKKITFGDMREMGVHGVLIYCAGYRCSRSITTDAG